MIKKYFIENSHLRYGQKGYPYLEILASHVKATDNLIECSLCNKPAIILDSTFPYHFTGNKCERHIDNE